MPSTGHQTGDAAGGRPLPVMQRGRPLQTHLAVAEQDDLRKQRSKAQAAVVSRHGEQLKLARVHQSPAPGRPGGNAPPPACSLAPLLLHTWRRIPAHPTPPHPTHTTTNPTPRCPAAHLVKEAKGLGLWLQQAHHRGHLHDVREVAQALHDLHRRVAGEVSGAGTLLQLSTVQRFAGCCHYKPPEMGHQESAQIKGATWCGPRKPGSTQWADPDAGKPAEQTLGAREACLVGGVGVQAGADLVGKQRPHRADKQLACGPGQEQLKPGRAGCGLPAVRTARPGATAGKHRPRLMALPACGLPKC